MIVINKKVKMAFIPLTVLFFLFKFSEYGYTNIPPDAENIGSEEARISVFFNALVDALENDYVNRKDYDWPKIREQILSKALQSETFEESLPVSSELFDNVKCNHCQLFMGENFFASTLNESFPQEAFSLEFLIAYQDNPSFSVELVDDKYGYINMPGMLLIDLTVEELSALTQEMYDEIVSLAKNDAIEGWIIDLRFNIGGNAYPMIAALHHLLGDRDVYGVKDNDGNVLSTQRLEEGKFFTEETLRTQITANHKVDTQTPVALLIGKLTSSAGENVAVAFKQRENVTYIGEESYGHLTSNSLVELPEGGQFAITTGYVVDQRGVYRNTIEPNITVIKGDNFENLLLDEKVIEALKFFESLENAN